MTSSVKIAAIFLLIIGIFDSTNCDHELSSAEWDLPPGFTAFPDINVAYKVYTEKLSWADAKKRCYDDYSELAIIDTRQKVSYVAGIKPAGAYVWVGISRTSEGSPWTKISDGSQLSNIPWAPGKPTRGSNNCLTVRGCNRGLSNENCLTSKVFVCQFSLDREIVTQS